ncbi:hypothetical protein [Salinispira pacifica]|uniref:Tryptophan-rich sensory protein n=1 Tax=Salinispira pacifica TaxID=1307761 RepID=V5WEK9_9SPIO|nr:hypothetical protein [Salinispira pacifica]AHC14050.1 hypothetical protein L21SP2_0621 [Salinispira pacifica]
MAETRTYSRQLLWAVVNAAALIVALVFNALATLLPLNGNDTGEISDMYPNLFVPAGLTFSIWGVIYLLLFAFVIYSLIRVIVKKNAEYMLRIGPWFLISSLSNAAWIVAWHYLYVGLSLGIIVLLFASLLVIYLKLGVGLHHTQTTLPGGSQPLFSDPSEKHNEIRWVHLPFSVYLGWLSVAVIANATSLLVTLNWNGFGLDPQIWTVAVLAVAVIIGLLIIHRRADIGFTAVFIWAFFGIWLKRSGSDLPPDQAVEISALIALGILAIAIVAKRIVLARR